MVIELFILPFVVGETHFSVDGKCKISSDTLFFLSCIHIVRSAYVTTIGASPF